jgi:hypothetical protein
MLNSNAENMPSPARCFSLHPCVDWLYSVSGCIVKESSADQEPDKTGLVMWKLSRSILIRPRRAPSPTATCNMQHAKMHGWMFQVGRMRTTLRPRWDPRFSDLSGVVGSFTSA